MNNFIKSVCVPLWQRFFFIATLFVLVQRANSQGYLYNESFPNSFNTGFTTPISSSSYTGSSGTWTFSSNDRATVVCHSSHYNSSPYALKLVNYSTSGYPTSTSKAASPAYNLSAWGCSPNVNATFKIYNYTLSSVSCYTLYVDFSSDGGTNWTTVWQKTAAQLLTAYGSQVWSSVSIDIPAAYRTTSFKLRFRGVQQAGCNCNSYVYIDDVKIYTDACSTPCTGRVTSLYFNKLDGGTDIPITNGSTFSPAQLGSLYNLEAGTTGTVGSVKFTISGPTPTSNIENTVPYNSPGTGSGAWTGAPGSYSVNLKTYSSSNAGGTLCHDTTITFNLQNDCNCPTTLITNGSFESGSTGWSVSGGSITTGTSYAMCGTKNGYLNWSSGTAKIWQDVTGIAVGSSITLKAYAGTHAPGLACSPKISLIFLNASNGVISQSDVAVTFNVGSGNILQLYTVSATAPAGTVKVRVQGSITCNTLKLDGLCLSVIPPASLGDFVWQDLNSNGIQDAGEPGIQGVTVELRDNSNNLVGTTTTAANGSYSFTGLAPGTYSVTFITPAGYISSPENAGSDDTKDSDAGAGGVVSGITLAAGDNNTTVDAGFIKLINLSGNVWHDVNAMTDNLVNNTGPSQSPPAAPVPANLIAYLVNLNTNLVEKVTFVNPADGKFSFTNVTPNTNYYVLISTAFGILNVPPPAVTLPSGWLHTGQQLGSPAVTGHDGLNDGRLIVPVGSSDVININFGIRKSGGDVVIG